MSSQSERRSDDAVPLLMKLPEGSKPGPVLVPRRTVPAPAEGEELQTVARLQFRAMTVPGVLDTRISETDLPEVAEEKRIAAEARQAREAELVKERGEIECIDRLFGAREQWTRETATQIAAEREQIRQACEAFAQERSRYFAGIESQVVRLALAIAQRVLHRESQLDPLMLEATARMALGKIADGSAVILSVPVAVTESWQVLFSGAGDSQIEVKADPSMQAGECRLETAMGTVELGVEAQLGEIERGFFDLLERRPA